MGIFGKAKEKIKSVFSRGGKHKGVVKYQIKEKAPGGRWKKTADVNPEQLEQMIEMEKGPEATIEDWGPEDIEDLNPGHWYRAVEIIDEEGTHGETIWGPYREPPQEKATNAAPQSSMSNGSLIKVNTQRMKGIKQDIESLQQVQQVMQEINTTFQKMGQMGAQQSSQNDKDERQYDTSDIEYKGELPAFAHPEVMKNIGNVAKDVIGSVSSEFIPKLKGGDGNEGKVEGEDLDEKLDNVLGDE